MDDHSIYEEKIKFRPQYKWPKEGSNKNCPRCGRALTLNLNLPTFMGKPWWCDKCQWQFTDEEVS